MKSLNTKEMFDCIPEVDFDSGFKYFLGNMDNYKQALMAILKSSKAKLPILRTMLYTGEYEGLRMILQTLSKMFHHTGAQVLSEKSYHLEYVLLNAKEDEIEIELDHYIQSLDTFIDHLELLMKQLNVRDNNRNDDILMGKYDFTKTRESIKLSSKLLERKII